PESTVNEDGFADVKNFVYGIGIDKFFKESKLYSNFIINNRSYNLATAKGRAEFVREIPNIVHEAKNDPVLKENSFILGLQFDEIKDARLNDFLTTVKTSNLNNITTTKIAELTLGLKQLKTTSEFGSRLHDALFFYTLITGKGSRGKHSFSS